MRSNSPRNAIKYISPTTFTTERGNEKLLSFADWRIQLPILPRPWKNQSFPCQTLRNYSNRWTMPGMTLLSHDGRPRVEVLRSSSTIVVVDPNFGVKVWAFRQHLQNFTQRLAYHPLVSLRRSFVRDQC